MGDQPTPNQGGRQDLRNLISQGARNHHHQDDLYFDDLSHISLEDDLHEVSYAESVPDRRKHLHEQQRPKKSDQNNKNLQRINTRSFGTQMSKKKGI